MPLKKIICIFTAVMTVFLSLPLSSFAFGDEVTETGSFTPEYRLSSPDCKNTEAVLSETLDVKEFKTFLLENISKTNVFADISRFNIPLSAWEEMANLIFYGMPEAFNVYEIGFSYDAKTLHSIHFGFREFADTPKEYADCIGKMKENADKLLLGIENNFALSDEYKALLLHDRLCVHSEYPFYTDITDVEHTAYGALVNGSSVCQGYAMAYMYLLNRVGIRNYYVSSDKLNHAWNIVYIDGKPYHVDVAFDDINWETDKDDRNVQGALNHNNFLRSTRGLKSEQHNVNDFDSTPQDTKYDNYYWQNSHSEFQLVGNKIYYIDSKNEALMCVGKNEALASVKDQWVAGENAHWAGNFSRLSSAGGELFFSTSDSIYKYTVTSGETEKIYSPYLHDKFSIYGLTYQNGKLVYDANTAPPGGDVTFLKRESLPYGNISHIMCSLQAKCEEIYYIGDSFNSENVVVTAHFTDNTRVIIKNGAKFSGFNSTSQGEKTVTVSYEGFITQFTVEVKTPSVTLPKSINLKENETKTLTAKTDPSGQKITWTSSSSAVTVKDGKITGIKTGTADITAEFTYNGRTYSAVSMVTVPCPHKNTAVHKEIFPTADKIGYTEGVFCKDCKKYVSGHKEIPKLNLSFSPSDFMVSDGRNVRIIVGKLVTELLWSAPEGSIVLDKNGNRAGDRSFVSTGMVLVLPDNSKQQIAVIGDVDGDAQLTSSDARLALRTSVGLEAYTEASPYYIAADVEKGDAVSSSDARAILRASVGLDDPGEWLN